MLNNTAKRAHLLTGLLALMVAALAGSCTSAPTQPDNTPQLRGAGSFLTAHQTSDGNKPLYASSHALVIGIDSYPKATRLSGAARDARAVAQELEARGVQVELLINEQATRSGILKVLTQLLKERVKQDDRFIMYFAGHGHTVGNADDAIGYLLPHDAGFDDVAITGISMGDVQDLFRVIEARHAMFVADACYSGLALPRMRGHTTDIPGYLERAIREETRVALVAGSSNQQVIDNWQGHGLFTYFFLEGIRGSADFNHDRLVTTQELLTFVSDRVQRTAYDMFAGHAQEPHMGKVGEGDLVFVVSEGEDTDLSVSPGETSHRGSDSGGWLEPEDVALLCRTPEDCLEVGALFLARGRAHKAAVFYNYACTHQLLEACVEQGVIAEEVLKDPEQARAQYERACSGDLAEGCRRLGLLAEVGPVVTRDQKLAADYYRIACELNEDSEGCNELAALCEKTNTLSACQPCAEGAEYLVSKGCSCESEAIYVAERGCKCLDGAKYDGGCACAGGAHYVPGQGCTCEGTAYEVAQGCRCAEGEHYCAQGGCIPADEPCARRFAAFAPKPHSTPLSGAEEPAEDDIEVQESKAKKDKQEEKEEDVKPGDQVATTKRHRDQNRKHDPTQSTTQSTDSAPDPTPPPSGLLGSGGRFGGGSAAGDLIEAKRQVAIALQGQGAALRTCHARNVVDSTPVTIELSLEMGAMGLNALDIAVRDGQAPAAFLQCVRERVEATSLPVGWEFKAARVLTFGE